MAPALTVTPQFNHYDAVNETEKLSHRRRALASVDNLSIPMEEDDMGLQNQPSLAKDSQEMEQILVDLGNSDLVQADLLQAIKTLESGGDTLSTGDPDGIFPLSGFDLADPVDSESDATEDKIRLMQARLDRRCAFLLRRLRILQARAIGKRISEEASQTFDKCTKGARKDGGGRPMGLKALLKRIETTASLQASAASRSVVGPKYYRAGSSKGDASRSASIGIPSGTLTGLEDSAGALRSHLSVVKQQLDSDATASSSGAESNDETVTYNNPHQQPMPIEKRALYSYQKARASVAARWCWLQVQVQELEYKIRQHSELHAQVREAKGPVEFESPPGGSEGAPSGESCARLRPLRRDAFKKRKLLQMRDLHVATAKAAGPADVRCRCVSSSCGVCTGRASPAQPAPPRGTQPGAAARARADPAHHAVLSLPAELSPSLHLAALSSRPWFGSRVRSSAPPRAPPAPAPPPPRHRRLPTKLRRGRPPLSRRVKERDRDDDGASGQDRARGRSSTEMRVWRRQSYDIDNIVIPQSVAANTRPEILTYKEIITPKWRVMEIRDPSLNNGVSRSNRMSMESDDEDISEAAVQARHTRAETRERNKFLRKRTTRRRNTHEDAHEDARDDTRDHTRHDMRHDTRHDTRPDTRDHTRDPVPEVAVRPPEPPVHETVPPYSPRQFPLKDDLYQDMLSTMPEGYRPISPEPDLDPDLTMEEDTSSLSPLSPVVFEGDDPDDTEWNPSAEKSERRKSTLR